MSLKSMTAYAQTKLSTVIGEISCEMRGVNHRFLELAPRMPEELRPFESEMRDLVSSKLSRGRIDAFIRLSETEVEKHLSKEVVAQIASLSSDVEQLLPNAEPIRVVDVLRWPGVLQAKAVDQDQLKSQFLQLIEDTVEQLLRGREREGEKIAQLVQQRLTAMADVLSQLRENLPEIAQLHRQRLQTKLGELAEQLDPQRLEQEVVLFLQKSDVAEELDRLDVHIEEVTKVLVSGKPAGRRLDFLMQELNREANTLGSKSVDTRMTQASVDLKVLIEQMREQIQNIE